MSVASIQPSYSIVSNHSLAPLDNQLSIALDQLDMDAVKDLVLKGANPNTSFHIDLCQDIDKVIGIIQLVQDKKGVATAFFDAIFKNLMGDNAPNISDIFSKEGLETSQFLDAATALIKETVGLLYPHLGGLFGEDKDITITLLELAVGTRDLELLQALCNSGKLENTSREFEIASFFSVGFFTDKSVEMINCMLDQGYSMDQLLGSNETIEEVLEEAFEAGDAKMVSFFKEHGFKLEEYEWEACPVLSFIEEKSSISSTQSKQEEVRSKPLLSERNEASFVGSSKSLPAADFNPTLKSLEVTPNSQSLPGEQNMSPKGLDDANLSNIESIKLSVDSLSLNSQRV